MGHEQPHELAFDYRRENANPCTKDEWCVLQDGHADSCEVQAGPLKKEAVDHPPHYGGADNVYEHIKVCDAWGLNYRLGNATKYIARAGKKTDNPLEDLKKARWYIDSEIKRLEGS
jgi:hypothetical protein